MNESVSSLVWESHYDSNGQADIRFLTRIVTGHPSISEWTQYYVPLESKLYSEPLYFFFTKER